MIRQRSPRIVAFQPHPVQTLKIDRDDGRTGIIRRWRAREARHCRLCPAGCTLSPAVDGQAICYVEVNGPVADGSAPLFASA